METNPTEQPKSAVWPLIRAHIIETRGHEDMMRQLPDGSIVRATVAVAFERCVDLDIIGNADPENLVMIIQEGIDLAAQQ